MPGPLEDLRIVEITGFGPGPMAGMLLADHGAEVVRIERPAGHDAGFEVDPKYFLHNRGKRLITLDLKKPEALEVLLKLTARADALIEGFRPGVAERLGFGPAACRARNPRLVYARVTGWGQTGPYSQYAGHDLNYVASSGALELIGSAGGPPVPPLNLVADFGGGAMYCVFGILAAIHERSSTGLGQVVDVAMAEGALSLLTSTFGYTAAGIHIAERGTNVIDGGAPHYGIYATSDGGYVTVAALEPQFMAKVLAVLELDASWLERRKNRADWPELRRHMADAFRRRTRREWQDLLERSDTCVTSVLSIAETAAHPQFAARHSVMEVDGVLQPGLAPRFERHSGHGVNPVGKSSSADALLNEIGVAPDEASRLKAAGAVR